MDAVKFLEERDRMCGHGCANCPACVDMCDIYSPDCDYESLVEAVEAWAEEHPRKTRQSEFLKQWPNASVSENGILEVWPCIIDKTLKSEERCLPHSCAECHREFWMGEVE